MIVKAKCIENDPKMIPSIVDYWANLGLPAEEGKLTLTIGRMYPIVGIIYWEKMFAVLTKDDSGWPRTVYAGLFEPFIGEIPSGWLFSLGPGAQSADSDLWKNHEIATWAYPEFVLESGYDEGLYDGESTAIAIFNSHIDEAAAEDPMSLPVVPIKIRARLRMAMREASELPQRQINQVEEELKAQDWLRAIEYLLVALRDSGSELSNGRKANLMDMILEVDKYRDLTTYYL